VLKYTYVTGYYIPEVSAERGLFEYLQEDLEKTTELLSEVLESSDISKDRFAALNVIQLAKNRKANLLKGVEEGLTPEVK
jgi:DNA polymerase III psi subunit